MSLMPVSHMSRKAYKTTILTTDMFVRRRKAMQVWGAFLCGVLDLNWKWTEPTVSEIILQKELDVEIGFDYDASYCRRRASKTWLQIQPQ